MTTEQERNRRWPRVNFRAGDLAPDLRARAGEDAGESAISAIARHDLTRYYRLLRQSIPRLHEGEWLLLMDVLNGTLLDENSVRYLWAEVADALEADPSLEQKWSVSGQGLVDQLRNLSYAELIAIADAAERFWLTAGQMDAHEALRQLGMIRDADATQAHGA